MVERIKEAPISFFFSLLNIAQRDANGFFLTILERA